MGLWEKFDKDPGPWATPKDTALEWRERRLMTCNNCEKLQLEIDAMNAEIEEMFVFAFACGFEACGEQCIKAVSDKITGCLESSLFPDLAKKYMKDYFAKHNPPSRGEKDD